MSIATKNETKSQHNPNPNPNAHHDSGSGYLEISEKGFGFLRTAENHFHPKPSDIFVTPDTIKRSFLREGSLVEGVTQPPHRGNSPQLKTVEKVNGMLFEDYTLSYCFWWTAFITLGVGRLPEFAKPDGSRLKEPWRIATTRMMTAICDLDCLASVQLVAAKLQ